MSPFQLMGARVVEVDLKRESVVVKAEDGSLWTIGDGPVECILSAQEAKDAEDFLAKVDGVTEDEKAALFS